MQEWDELLNDDLWNSFRTKFAEWIYEDFKLTSITCQKKLRTFLRFRDVWVMKSSTQIIAKSLVQVVKKDILILWTEEEIRSCLKSKTFVSHVINHFLQTNFDRDSKNYSWRTSSSRSESRHSESFKSTKSRISFIETSSSRERSVQQKLVTREMQQSLIKSLHQSSIRNSFRESSIARNFLRQSFLSLSQSKQNFYSRQSSLSENFYSDLSSSSENLYIRHSEKESMLRQSF
jgi:hypothetical protein